MDTNFSQTPRPMHLLNTRGLMKVSKVRSQPEIAADIRLLGSLHGSGCTILLRRVLMVTHMTLLKCGSRGQGTLPVFEPWQLIACEAIHVRPLNPRIVRGHVEPVRYLDPQLRCSWQVVWSFSFLVLFIFTGGLQKQSFLLPYQE